MMSKSLGVAVAAFAAAMQASAAQAAVAISTKPTQNMSCSGGVCSPTAKRAVLNLGDLANMLASDATVTSGNLAQDIEIDAALSWTSANRLTLDSYRSIDFNNAVSVAGSSGALTIKTNDGGAGGDFQFFGKGHVKFWDIGSDLVINGNRYTLISTMKELKFVANHHDPFVALASNLDLERHNYTEAPIPDLGGMFEGLGNTISNLNIVSSKPSVGLALIGRCDGFQAGIRDLTLVGVDIQGSGSPQTVAPLAAVFQYGLIKSVHASGSVAATGSGSIAAGLVGSSDGGTISQSTSTVILSNSDGLLTGGLVAKFLGCDSRCPSGIETSFASGAIVAGNGALAGGVVADHVSGRIMNAYFTGSVQGGSNSVLGGLIGKNENNDGDTQILSSYSTGAVSAGSGSTVGGLIGQDLAGGGNSNTYWDLDTSGISNPHQGAGNIPDDPGITGLTDAQLKSGLPAGFDKKVWAQNPKINNGYPYLIANPPPK